MKNAKTIDVDATVKPTNEPGIRGKVESPAPEAKPPATKQQLRNNKIMTIIFGSFLLNAFALIQSRRR